MTNAIYRDPCTAAGQEYDLIVIGGGIHGACLLLEAATRGLRVLLIEKHDFGGETSWNSLRIVHGGLRYLQHLDLRRFHESVRERQWFLSKFPELVKPQRCLMPLYGRGLKRPSVLRAALATNELLSRRRNAEVPADRILASSRVIGADATAKEFPAVRGDGLRGGALWFDAVMVNPARLLIEILRWACHCGATALNYVEARQLLVTQGRVTGIEAIDTVANATLQLHAPLIVNCAGPWCGVLADKLLGKVSNFFHPSLAFNMLIKKPLRSAAAVAVTPPRPGARTYFLVPFDDYIYAGTYYAPVATPTARPSKEDVTAFVRDLNEAVPSLHVEAGDVSGIFSGCLPATTANSTKQARRSRIIDHAGRGGPRGFYSVNGVKFTTARAVAETTLKTIYSRLDKTLPSRCCVDRPATRHGLDLNDFDTPCERDAAEFRRQLRLLAADESVVHLDDLIMRRTDWWFPRHRLLDLAEVICDLLACPEEQRQTAMRRMECVTAKFSVPGTASDVCDLATETSLQTPWFTSP